MEKGISVVICSRENNEEKDKLIEQIKNTCGCDCAIFFMFNPDGVSLTRIYQDVLHKEDVKTNIIVYMHDDIEFLKKGWGKEIVRLFNENPDYGIIGVAGSAEFDEKAAWWNYKKIYGQVLHRHDGKSWLTAFSPLLDKDLEEVCVVDGLFFAVDKERITKEFDTDINGFNFYEIDFCLNNFLDGKTKIGVTTNIRIAHNSIGELKPEWYGNREYVNNKYGEHYPIKVKK
jgi:hypothetical protein